MSLHDAYLLALLAFLVRVFVERSDHEWTARRQRAGGDCGPAHHDALLDDEYELP